MTRYTVAVPAEVLTVADTGEQNLIIKLPSGSFLVPLAAFTVDATPMISIGDVADMSMHRICALIDNQMRRIKQLELDMAAARRAGYAPPPPPPAPPPVDKPLREYKPLDHGPRDNDAAAEQYRRKPE